MQCLSLVYIFRRLKTYTRTVWLLCNVSNVHCYINELCMLYENLNGKLNVTFGMKISCNRSLYMYMNYTMHLS